MPDIDKQATQSVHVIGGGLAGSEAAWQIAAAGVPVVLHEMRPTQATAAHKTDGLAELVCSNSFRSDDRENNAVGLLHEEMRRLGSLVMRAADAQPGAGRRRACGRPRRIFESRHPGARRPSADRDPPRGGRRLPPPDWDNVIVATGPSPRRRSPRRSAGSPARTRSPSSTPSRRSCIATASTWTWPGSSRATTRRAPAARAPITSTARSIASNTRPSSRRWSRATRRCSKTGRRPRPISTAACRSR